MKIALMIKFLLDKNIPLKEKWIIILPMIYILSPIDLIPFPVLGFSIIDDLIVFIFMLSIISSKTKKYYGNKTDESDDSQEFDDKDKTIIEGISYEVNEETNENNKK